MVENGPVEEVNNTTTRGKEVTIIQCTDSKRNEKAPARELYDESGYFCDMRDWAKSRNVPWYILSAKHGLVNPNTVLEPYNEFGISESQSETIAEQLHEKGIKVVYICAGMKYTGPLIPSLENIGIDVVNPFSGMGIGERRNKLQIETSKLLNTQL